MSQKANEMRQYNSYANIGNVTSRKQCKILMSKQQTS